MYSIDQFIDSCESLKIYPYDYCIGMEDGYKFHNAANATRIIVRLIQTAIMKVKKLLYLFKEKIMGISQHVKIPKEISIEGIARDYIDAEKILIKVLK